VTAFVVVLHVLTCFALVAIVLLQHGKGADIGAAFGAGASQTVFGSRGAGDFLTKLTTGAAVVFMLTSLTLSYFLGGSTVSEIVAEEAEVSEFAPEAPPAEAPESTFPEASPIPTEEPAEGDVPAGFEEIPPPSEAPPPEPR
jgi:preprotein translocase subunit SecG